MNAFGLMACHTERPVRMASHCCHNRRVEQFEGDENARLLERSNRVGDQAFLDNDADRFLRVPRLLRGLDDLGAHLLPPRPGDGLQRSIILERRAGQHGGFSSSQRERLVSPFERDVSHPAGQRVGMVPAQGESTSAERERIVRPLGFEQRAEPEGLERSLTCFTASRAASSSRPA